MSSFKRTYTIVEYGGFTGAIEVPGYQALPRRAFDLLEKFILTNSSDTQTDLNELLALSARRDIGKIITARNYVGLITMTDGTVI